MFKALFGAFFDSIMGAIFGIFNRKREEKHRDDAVALEAIAVSQTERKLTETEIETAAKAARDNATPDFRTLR
jgi:hypothetical protein